MNPSNPIQELVADIVNSLKEFSDPKRIEFANRVYPTSLKVFGVITPQLKAILKELKAATKDFSPTEKIALAKSLIDTEVFECHQLGFDYIDNNRKTIPHLFMEDINHLGSHLDNWVSTDYFGSYILGGAWQRGVVDIETILEYAHSEDFWKRRVALVATVALNQKARGGKGDTNQTLRICNELKTDHHDMIVKAMSWALRILSQVDRNSVIEYLEENQALLHPRVIREVNRKLDTGKKN